MRSTRGLAIATFGAVALAWAAACGLSVTGSDPTDAGGGVLDGSTAMLPEGAVSEDVAVANVDGSSSIDDAGVVGDAADDDSGFNRVDAGGRCDPTKGFGVPELVPGLSSPGVQEAHAWISNDERMAVLILGTGSAREIYQSTRPTPTAAFGTPLLVNALSSDADEDNATLTQDGLTIVFASNREEASSTNFELWFSTRITGSFVQPQKVAGANSTATDQNPFLLSNGNAIYFDSNRTGAEMLDIYVTRPASSGNWTDATKVLGVNGATHDSQPVVTADELVMIFTSERTPTLGYGDLWEARRASKSDPFGTPVHLDAPMSSGSADLASWISDDNCVLYFSSDRINGQRDMYRAQRPQ